MGLGILRNSRDLEKVQKATCGRKVNAGTAVTLLASERHVCNTRCVAPRATLVG